MARGLSSRPWSSPVRSLRVGEARLRKTLLAEQAGVAEPAGAAIGLGHIARPRQREVDVQLVGPRDDLGLAELDERGVDAEVALALDAGLGRQIGQLLERLRELRPAVGIAGVIDRIDADE